MSLRDPVPRFSDTTSSSLVFNLPTLDVSLTAVVLAPEEDQLKHGKSIKGI